MTCCRPVFGPVATVPPFALGRAAVRLLPPAALNMPWGCPRGPSDPCCSSIADRFCISACMPDADVLNIIYDDARGPAEKKKDESDVHLLQRLKQSSYLLYFIFIFIFIF
jgi:hypothetical protein